MAGVCASTGQVLLTFAWVSSCVTDSDQRKRVADASGDQCMQERDSDQASPFPVCWGLGRIMLTGGLI